MATTQIKKLQVGSGAVQFINEGTSEILAQFTPSSSLKLYRKDDQILIMDKSGMQHTVKASLVTKLTYGGIDNAFSGTVQQLWNELATNFFFELDLFSTFSPVLFDAVVAADGSGDYTTLGAAVGAGACSIFVKDGTVTETASTTLGDNCAVYGESAGAVIVYPAAEGLVVNGGGTDKTAGTIAVTKGDATVTGTGTSFAESDVGRTIVIGLDFFTVTTFTSATEIEIDSAWQGDTTTGLSYIIRDYTTGVILDTLSIIGSGGASSPISFTKSLNCTLKNIYTQGGGQENALFLESGRIAIDNLISKGAVLNGVKLEDCIGVKVSKSTASNCQNAGFLVAGGVGISLSQCFASNNLNGFEVTDSGDDIVIDNVNASYNDEDGVEINFNGNVIVSNSTFKLNGTNGIYSVSDRCEIIGNNVSGKGKAAGGNTGITVDSGPARIIGNYVELSATGIVVAPPTPGSVISGNEVKSCNLCYNCQDDDSIFTSNIAADFDLRGFLITGDNNSFVGNQAFSGTGVNNNGFEITGTGNTLVGNNSYNNARGYRINANGNQLLSNDASGNSTADYSIGAVTSYTDQTSYANLGLGGSPNASAILTLESTSKGLLLPRMTAAQASAITGVDGLTLYVTDTDATFTSVGFWGYESGAWVKL